MFFGGVRSSYCVGGGGHVDEGVEFCVSACFFDGRVRYRFVFFGLVFMIGVWVIVGGWRVGHGEDEGECTEVFYIGLVLDYCWFIVDRIN